MATGPVNEPRNQSGSEPDLPDRDEVEELRRERDGLRSRAQEAEQIAEQLAEELAEARRRLGEHTPAEPEDLPLFEDFGQQPDDRDPSRSADGSNLALLPVALAGTAAVAFLATLVALANQGVLALAPWVSGALFAGLAWGAWATRVISVEVAVADGTVTIQRGKDVHRFDLGKRTTELEVRGQPGDSDWRVRFPRRGLTPIDVDARMVEPEDFMAKLRRYRDDV